MFEFFTKGHQILGMNARNLEYIRPNNLLAARHIADNKLLSKRMLKKNGVSISALIAKIECPESLEKFDWQSLPTSFALKPNRGFGGEGIIIVYGKKKDRDDAWIKADGSIITIEDIKNHVHNILDGSFSLSNTPDIAFFEERLKLLKLFKPYSFKGIPDIRVIVFNKVPVMAMLRLPTKESGGKANLHLGAIGVGIDMATGITTTAFQGVTLVEKVHGTRLALSGIKIPYWKEILTLAVKTQYFSSLGYLGADIAIDAERGPVILELNARPGLGIQIANLAGLKKRLERVAGLKIQSIEKGVRVGMDLFGGEVEENVEEISGKKVIGAVEKVKLIGKNRKEIEILAKIDTGAGFSSMDTSLAKAIGFEKTVEAYESLTNVDYEQIKNLGREARWSLFKNIPDIATTVIVKSSHGTTYRPTIKVTLSIGGASVLTKVTLIKRSNLQYPIIIGRKNLKRFLIDVNK